MAHHKYTVVVQAPGHQEKRYRIMASSPSEAKRQVEYAAGELPRGAYVSVVPVSMRGRRGQSLRPNPSLVHHSIGYPTKAQAEKAKRTLEARGGGPYRLSHEGSVVPGREKLGWWYVVGPKVSNPGPSAIPTRWTPATITARGKQVQIRIGGRR